MKHFQLPLRSQLERRAGDIDASAWGGAVEVAVAVHNQTTSGKAAIIAAVEGVKHLQFSLRRELEHGALIESSSFGGGAIEVAVAIQDQTSVRIGTLAGDEGMEHLFFALGRYLVNRSEKPGAS